MNSRRRSSHHGVRASPRRGWPLFTLTAIATLAFFGLIVCFGAPDKPRATRSVLGSNRRPAGSRRELPVATAALTSVTHAAPAKPIDSGARATPAPPPPPAWPSSPVDPEPDRASSVTALPTPPAPPTSAPALARAEAPARASRPRTVPSSALEAWSKPGLCARSSEAADARETISSSFKLVDLADGGKLYLDPRLPADAERPILEDLDQAAAETAKRLNLRPTRPLVFIYFDQPLMKAAACINGDVVAFYDGALHIVAGRPDVAQSVLHEYTHHALFSAGMIGPAWAQEGIAMTVAGERWWRDGRYLRTLADHPFGMDDMDRSIPYKLAPEQAVAFYVEAAALVECVMRRRNWTLRQLFEALQANAGAHSDASTYDLPELDDAGFPRNCAELVSH